MSDSSYIVNENVECSNSLIIPMGPKVEIKDSQAIEKLRQAQEYTSPSLNQAIFTKIN